MSEIVEGEWKSFVFKMAKPEDYSKILLHLRHNFHVDEPLNKIVKFEEEDIKVLDAFVLKTLEKGLSFLAIHKESGDVAGVRITDIEFKTTDEKESKILRPKLAIVYGFLTKCSEGDGDVFKNFPEIDKYANLLMASVDSKYRGQGLVTEMYRRSLKFLKSQGFQVAKSIFTNPFTRKAVAKLGFFELKSVRFLDYKDPQGLPYLIGAQDCELGSSMAIRL